MAFLIVYIYPYERSDCQQPLGPLREHKLPVLIHVVDLKFYIKDPAFFAVFGHVSRGGHHCLLVFIREPRSFQILTAYILQRLLCGSHEEEPLLLRSGVCSVRVLRQGEEI